MPQLPRTARPLIMAKPPIDAPDHAVNAEAMTDKEIADINDSWELALLHHGMSPQEVRELRQTVEDAIANNMG